MSLTQLPAWQALAEHQKMRDCMRDLFAADPHRLTSSHSRWAICSSTTPRTASPKRRCRSWSIWRRWTCLPPSKRCSRARRSIQRKTGPSCVALRNRSGRPIYVDGRRHAQGAGGARQDGTFLRSGPFRQLEGLYGQGHHRRREHRHRRLRSGPAHGHPRPEAVRPRAAAGSFRVERRPDRHRRNAEDARSRNDLVPRRVENFHDAGDDDERTHGPRLVPKARARRARGR